MYHAFSKALKFYSTFVMQLSKRCTKENNLLSLRCSAREPGKPPTLPVKGICQARGAGGGSPSHQSTLTLHFDRLVFLLPLCYLLVKQYSPNTRSLASPKNTGFLPAWLSLVPCFWKGKEKDLFMCLFSFLPPLSPPFLTACSPLLVFVNPPSWLATKCISLGKPMASGSLKTQKGQKLILCQLGFWISMTPPEKVAPTQPDTSDPGPGLQSLSQGHPRTRVEPRIPATLCLGRNSSWSPRPCDTAFLRY